MQEENNQMENAVVNDPLNLMQDPAPVVAEAPAAPTQGHRKIRVGLVVSNKMNKSIVVAVVRRVRHPLYKKYFNKTRKYMAHDETNDCKVGDTVRIVETRPLSSRKRWRLDAVIERAK